MATGSLTNIYHIFHAHAIGITGLPAIYHKKQYFPAIFIHPHKCAWMKRHVVIIDGVFYSFAICYQSVPTSKCLHCIVLNRLELIERANLHRAIFLYTEYIFKPICCYILNSFSVFIEYTGRYITILFSRIETVHITVNSQIYFLTSLFCFSSLNSNLLQTSHRRFIIRSRSSQRNTLC